MRTNRLAPVLLAVLALGVGGCGDGPTDSQANVRGTYELQDVNGSALPVTVAEAPDGRLQITSGTMVLRSDDSYTETVQLRAVYDTGQTETDTSIENGTYSMAGGTITFNVPASSGNQAYSYSGEVAGRTLSYTVSSLTLTFRKQ